MVSEKEFRGEQQGRESEWSSGEDDAHSGHRLCSALGLCSASLGGPLLGIYSSGGEGGWKGVVREGKR